MNQNHIEKIAAELKLITKQVHATALLLDDGATVPFISRYRKEATGSLDEVAVTAIRDRLNQLAELDARRDAIIKSLEERNLLTDELSEKIDKAQTMTELEDIYLPFRPKRRTRATIAKEKGLEPLAQLLFQQQLQTDPNTEAAAFVHPEKGVESVDDALAGMLAAGLERYFAGLCKAGLEDQVVPSDAAMDCEVIGTRRRHHGAR